jgi:hypothetical protein
MADIRTVNVYDYLDKAGTELVKALKTALPEKSHATSHLDTSIKFAIRPFGLTYVFELKLADYYEYVDKGRRAGKMPPVSEIIKWTTNKRLVFDNGKLHRATNDKKSKLNLLSKNLTLQSKIAWAIAKGIAKHGTKGTNFYTPTVEKWVENLKTELVQALKRDIIIQIKDI